ncbi:HNH endonuclease [Micromonospora sp. NBC_01638]|uniref:HNH endonuclease n=1 Tax=Micromonospora sp. NBC_01638 TaxID=2975982 RepID=UPI0038672D16|nr:hypothetical protein OG811_22365 [Micromonospora sp. NBC_01638]
MTARRRAPRVRYGGGDDRLLRLALLQEWGWRCYWRNEPLTVTTAQIDHIIARTVSPARLAELIGLHNLPAGFDLHTPENLAPICASCNNEKRDDDYLEVPAVSRYLEKARRCAPLVVRRVQDHTTTVAVGRALTEAATADLTRPQARQEFLDHAPAIVQTLALLDEDKAADYLVDRSFDINDTTVPLSLDARGRAAEAIIASLCGGNLAHAVSTGMNQLLDELTDKVTQRFHQRGSEDADWMPATTDRLTVSLELTDHARDGHLFHVDLTGTLSADFTATAVQSDQWGDSLIQLDAWAVEDCTFILSLVWDLRFTDDPDGEVTIDFTELYSDYTVSQS